MKVSVCIVRFVFMLVYGNAMWFFTAIQFPYRDKQTYISLSLSLYHSASSWALDYDQCQQKTGSSHFCIPPAYDIPTEKNSASLIFMNFLHCLPTPDLHLHLLLCFHPIPIVCITSGLQLSQVREALPIPTPKTCPSTYSTLVPRPVHSSHYLLLQHSLALHQQPLLLPHL